MKYPKVGDLVPPGVQLTGNPGRARRNTMVRSPSNIGLARDLYETYLASSGDAVPTWDDLLPELKNHWLSVANRAIELAYEGR